jgi:hypothetical protein
VSSVVPAEWHANAVGVTDEVKRHLTKIQDQSTHFHNACQSLGFSPGFGRAAYHSPGLAEKLRDLSQQILNISIPLDADSESRVRAFNRIMTSTPPAKKGAEVKDCTILEEYLELCRVARAAGFAKKLVFCTSNTRDYCLPGGAPHHNLAADYGAVGLVFTTNLTHATHEIKTP